MQPTIITSILAFAMLATSTLATPFAYPVSNPDFTLTTVEDLGDPTSAQVNGTNLETRGLMGYLQAFSGSNCDSGPGGVSSLPENTWRCIDTRNRHSFRIWGNCKYVQNWVYSDQSTCWADNNYGTTGNGCFKVNTGKNWQSIGSICKT